MLIIKARNKSTNAIEDFTPGEWYNAQQSGNYLYIGTSFQSVEKTATTSNRMTSTPTVKRGCGCGKKK